MFKLIIILPIFLFSTGAFSKNYYRFWRGHIAQEMNEENFVKGLNKIFIPETVEQGKGHGLNAYMPVMITRDSLAKEFPDELALVVYDSETKYKEIRKMPRGASYQKLHWKYFDKKSSKSRVPSGFLGKIGTERAYDLLESNSDWQKGKVQFLMRKFNTKFADASSDLKRYFTLIQNKAKNFGIKSHLVLIDEKGIYEYVLYDNSIDPRAESLLNSKQMKTLMNIVLNNKNKIVNFGEGANRQFSLVKSK